MNLGYRTLSNTGRLFVLANAWLSLNFFLFLDGVPSGKITIPTLVKNKI